MSGREPVYCVRYSALNKAAKVCHWSVASQMFSDKEEAEKLAAFIKAKADERYGDRLVIKANASRHAAVIDLSREFPKKGVFNYRYFRTAKTAKAFDDNSLDYFASHLEASWSDYLLKEAHWHLKEYFGTGAIRRIHLDEPLHAIYLQIGTRTGCFFRATRVELKDRFVPDDSLVDWNTLEVALAGKSWTGFRAIPHNKPMSVEFDPKCLEPNNYKRNCWSDREIEEWDAAIASEMKLHYEAAWNAKHDVLSDKLVPVYIVTFVLGGFSGIVAGVALAMYRDRREAEKLAAFIKVVKGDVRRYYTGGGDVEVQVVEAQCYEDAREGRVYYRFERKRRVEPVFGNEILPLRYRGENFECWRYLRRKMIAELRGPDLARGVVTETQPTHNCPSASIVAAVDGGYYCYVLSDIVRLKKEFFPDLSLIGNPPM